MSVSVVLFTGDLRLHDHPPLRAALAGADEVVPLFVMDSGIRAAGFGTPNRLAFLADCLADLDGRLRERGGRLVVRGGAVAREVRRVVEETGAGCVHLSAGSSRYARRREEDLRRVLAGTGCALEVHDAVTTVLAPGAVTPTGRGRDHFAVFTPYLRRWTAAGARAPLAAPRSVPVPAGVRGEEVPSRARVEGVSPGLAAGGESEARRRLSRWSARRLDSYAELGDDLAADATSRLSPHLHFGCLSPAEVVHRARRRGGAGADAFVRQLAWRDFHHQVLAARPDAAVRDYRPHGDRWHDDEREVAAWREGRTGFPLVDAAMRQLRHEGWMPGRGRLLAGSFLAKTLYADWRVGAAHFLDLLVDGDIAANQLNWQWVAGTGNDTRPGRVLNPLSQARRFDPRGDYVRRWVPELAGVEGAAVHTPWTLPAPERARTGYPPPIVDPADTASRFRRARGLS
ncbi:deoxyribodipyrimidine photo-lyase [Streptomyces verrucosisporus]|uniref:cryptochrome/photolyase family protein n=1 Tax=Streptomyces verrucosisporus TaxID=1695161 RepID=UPI0019D28A11|nr:deoxyribodipyrimidine photo-lyase [Streptomyces verrucosisporus]MBN3932536.1 deoxyribodipyrimidine photo-lyase [Streptomyces verrucosisporus]